VALARLEEGATDEELDSTRTARSSSSSSAEGKPSGCLNGAPCPPWTSHGASIRQRLGAAEGDASMIPLTKPPPAAGAGAGSKGFRHRDSLMISARQRSRAEAQEQVRADEMRRNVGESQPLLLS
jgi:hypothetical protein